jgi:hypothetical protein
MQVSRDQVEASLQAAWATDAGAGDISVSPDAGATPAAPAAEAGGATRKPMSAGGKTVLLNALAVALELGHNYIGTEHILLGLYRDPDSLAARVLAENGAEPSEARVRISELLRGYPKP